MAVFRVVIVVSPPFLPAAADVLSGADADDAAANEIGN